MRIYIHDDAAPGHWEVVAERTRRGETEPSKLKLATLLLGLAYDWLKELVAGAPADQQPEEEERPQIMLPGIDFPSGSLPLPKGPSV